MGAGAERCGGAHVGSACPEPVSNCCCQSSAFVNICKSSPEGGEEEEFK